MFGGNRRPSGGGRARFTYVPGPAKTDPASVALRPNHPALLAGRTLFPTRVFTAEQSGRVLVSGVHNAKIGGRVEKGRFAGAAIYTVTLEERRTCPSECHLWSSCYGNSMPLAKRHHYDEAFVDRLGEELRAAAILHGAKGFGVRLHVLGDFPDAAYVAKWAVWLSEIPTMFVWGYTAHASDSVVGRAIGSLNQSFAGRCSLRFSVKPESQQLPMQATTIWREARAKTPEGYVCLAETGDTATCGTCTLCWAPSAEDTRIVFLGHGMTANHAGRARTTGPSPRAKIGQPAMTVSTELLAAARAMAESHKAAWQAAERFTKALEAAISEADPPLRSEPTPLVQVGRKKPLRTEPPPRKGRPLAPWRSPERDEILARAWPGGEDVDRITEEMNRTPGQAISMDKVASYAYRLRLKRPKGYGRIERTIGVVPVAHRGPEPWSSERDELLRAAVQCAIPMQDITSELNLLDGPEIAIAMATARATAIRCSPPPDPKRLVCEEAYREARRIGKPFREIVLSLLKFLAEPPTEEPIEPPEAAPVPAPDAVVARAPSPPPAPPAPPAPMPRPDAPRERLTRAEAMARVAVASGWKPRSEERVPAVWEDIETWGKRNGVALTGVAGHDLQLINRRRMEAFHLPAFSVIRSRGPVDPLPDPSLGASFEGEAPRAY